jgi:ABC-type glycerol-3-phosphate transport system permease component
MDEERLVRVLEEIRDLQRQQVEAYARALSNQQEAMRLQREGLGRARKLLAGVGVIIVIVLVMVLVLLRYILRHYA